jgi:hypothetical protein
MTRTSTIRLAAFVVAFLAIGIPYWQIEYAKVQLPNSLVEPQLLVVVLASFVIRRFTGTSIWHATSLAGVAVPGAVAARVIVEATRDPTSHNLWPFEVVLAFGVGLIAAAVGALLGSWRRPDL